MSGIKVVIFSGKSITELRCRVLQIAIFSRQPKMVYRWQLLSSVNSIHIQVKIIVVIATFNRYRPTQHLWQQLLSSVDSLHSFKSVSCYLQGLVQTRSMVPIATSSRQPMQGQKACRCSLHKTAHRELVFCRDASFFLFQISNFYLLFLAH